MAVVCIIVSVKNSAFSLFSVWNCVFTYRHAKPRVVLLDGPQARASAQESVISSSIEGEAGGPSHFTENPLQSKFIIIIGDFRKSVDEQWKTFYIRYGKDSPTVTLQGHEQFEGTLDTQATYLAVSGLSRRAKPRVYK